MKKIQNFLLLMIMMASSAMASCPPLGPLGDFFGCPEVERSFVLKPCIPLAKQVQEDGVEVIAVGQDLRLILPADMFFEPIHGHFKESKAYVLADIARLLKCDCYGFYPIHVFGYTDEMGTINRQQTLGYREAHQIAALLWQNDIPVERFHIGGFGAQHSLSGNHTPIGSADNRRVEITL